MNVTLTVQVVDEAYSVAVQVPPAALLKSMLGTPWVTTVMLPTAVPAATEKLKVVAALGVPMATEPKFWAALVPV